MLNIGLLFSLVFLFMYLRREPDAWSIVLFVAACICPTTFMLVGYALNLPIL